MYGARTGNPWLTALGGIGGAVAGGVGVDTIKRMIGNVAAGGPVAPVQSAEQASRKALDYGVGELGGQAITRGLNRARLRSDVSLRDPAQETATREAAQMVNVPLTAGQVTDVPSVLATEDLVSQMPGKSSQTMAKAYKGQDEAFEGATGRFQESVSPGTDDVSLVAEQGREAAIKAVATAKKGRSDVTTPLYTAAFSSGKPADVSSVISTLNKAMHKKGKSIRGPLKRIKDMFYTEVPGHQEVSGMGIALPGKPKKVLIRDVERLHNIKLEIDALLGKTGDSAVSNVARRELRNAKVALVNALAEQVPEYEVARATV